jgi:hypothetical protein
MIHSCVKRVRHVSVAAADTVNDGIKDSKLVSSPGTKQADCDDNKQNWIFSFKSDTASTALRLCSDQLD